MPIVTVIFISSLSPGLQLRVIYCFISADYGVVNIVSGSIIQVITDRVPREFQSLQLRPIIVDNCCRLGWFSPYGKHMMNSLAPRESEYHWRDIIFWLRARILWLKMQWVMLLKILSFGNRHRLGWWLVAVRQPVINKIMKLKKSHHLVSHRMISKKYCKHCIEHCVSLVSLYVRIYARGWF